jgi:isopenicillin N synthase-like dioxygenase
VLACAAGRQERTHRAGCALCTLFSSSTLCSTLGQGLEKWPGTPPRRRMAQTGQAALATVDVGAFRRAPRGQALPPAAAAVVAQWRDAFRATGACHITDHGVPDATLQAAVDAAREFFVGSTEAERLAVAKDAARDGGNRGFRPMSSGSVSTTWTNADGTPLAERPKIRPNDLSMQFEMLGDELDPSPPHQPAFLPTLRAFHAKGVALSKLLMELTACSLGLDRAHFDSPFAHNSELNRLHAAFSPPGLSSEPADGAIRRGEHTDFESLTILWHERKGLQVRSPDSGEWIDAPPVPGGLTVNAGDLLQLWSNGVFRTCPHRVTNATDDDNETGRLSLVLFTGPSPSTLIEPLSTCVSRHRPALYAPIIAEEHVTRKLRASGNITPVATAAAASAQTAPGASTGRRHRRLRGHLRCLAPATAAALVHVDDPHRSQAGPASSNDAVLAAHLTRVPPHRRQLLDDAVVAAISAWPGGCGIRPPQRTSDPAEAACISAREGICILTGLGDATDFMSADTLPTQLWGDRLTGWLAPAEIRNTGTREVLTLGKEVRLPLTCLPAFSHAFFRSPVGFPPARSCTD